MKSSSPFLSVLFGLSLLSVLCVSETAKAQCNFEKLKLTQKKEAQSLFQIDAKRSILLDGADSAHKIHEGPGWLLERDEKKCKIDGGLFSALYVDRKKNVLMTQEYSGSISYTQMINLKDCSQINDRLSYFGEAKIRKNKITTAPICEPIEKNTSSCSSGKVFTINEKNCKLTLDEKASRALTRKELGLELPDLDKASTVENPQTPNAKILED